MRVTCIKFLPYRVQVSYTALSGLKKNNSKRRRAIQ